jgi:hypothetical protein
MNSCTLNTSNGFKRQYFLSMHHLLGEKSAGSGKQPGRRSGLKESDEVSERPRERHPDESGKAP